ncbi:MAG TPA: helix-turn-helix domain-containing protein, partial [Candidatus Acidoferrales bacterium]|nr:helix-turn-helix domain-containing protein [Candidatus Acidoferrales bacterium]
MEGKRPDRRVRRTRQLLHDALRSLSVQKGYDHVTVQDVIDRANVGRTTFYAHFRDKDDLLMSGVGEMREFLRRQLAAFAQSQDVRSEEVRGFASALFDHAAGHRMEYRALAGSRRGAAILKCAHNEAVSLIREYLDEAAT